MGKQKQLVESAVMRHILEKELEDVNGLNRELDAEVEEYEEANKALKKQVARLEKEKGFLIDDIKNRVTNTVHDNDLAEIKRLKTRVNKLRKYKSQTAVIKRLKAKLPEDDSDYEAERRRLATVPSPELPPTPCLDSPSLMSPSIMTVTSSLVLFMLGGVVFRRCLRKRRPTKEIADMTSIRIDRP